MLPKSKVVVLCAEFCEQPAADVLNSSSEQEVKFVRRGSRRDGGTLLGSDSTDRRRTKAQGMQVRKHQESRKGATIPV